MATYGIFTWQSPLACPVHSTGTPITNPTICTCNSPTAANPINYVPDSSRKECVSEQYTISLSGMGGEVMPTKTRAAYTEVTASDGSPKSGAQVTLILTVVPENGDPILASNVGGISPNGGATDADGRLSFVFTAPVAGGLHTITAFCTGCTNWAEGTIKVPGCPIPPLSAPPFNDACATVLENTSSTQAQKDAACGALTDTLKTGMACFRDKLSGLTPAIPMIVSSDIRSVAYQAHLREVWDKMESLVRLMNNNPAMQTACSARRTEIAAEKGCDKAGPCKSEPNEVCYPESSTQRSHCLVARPANPSPSDAQHTQGKAFDVSQTRTIDPLQDVLDARTPPQSIQQFLNTSPNCNLSWGGAFDDDVHFFVP